MENRHLKVQIVTLCDNEILLLQTKPDRNEIWQNVTGSVDPGEDINTAAQRELLEETGLNSNLQLLDLEFTFHDRWGKNVCEKVFYTILKSKQDIKICDDEHQAFLWKKINEVTKDDFGYPSNYKAFQEVLNCIK